MNTKKDKYYIASGFFNPEQVRVVESLELALKSLEMNAFSPRSESVNFNKDKYGSPLDLELKDAYTFLIFQNNLDNMNSGNKLLANLSNYDIGTLWELGYFLRNFTFSVDSKSLNIFSRELISNIKVVNDKFHVWDTIRKSLLDIQVSNANRNSEDENFITKSLYLDLRYRGLISDNSTVSSLLAEFHSESKVHEPIYLCIDDRPAYNIVLAGLFYGASIPVVTYSKKGYGSNVMLMHSAWHVDSVEKLGELMIQIDAGDISPQFLFTNNQNFNIEVE